MNVQRYQPHSRRGFTLIELLVSLAIFSILILALNTVLYGAFNLRDNAQERMMTLDAQKHVYQILKRDFMNMTAPSGVISGGLMGETVGNAKLKNDRIEFYTSTGAIDDLSKWGDIQKVQYLLVNDTELYANAQRSRNSMTLTRMVTRNVMATIEETPDPVPIVRHVRSLSIQYFDGDIWSDSWDSTTADPSMPIAISLRIDFEQEGVDANTGSSQTSPRNLAARLYPLEMMFPIHVVSPPEETEEEDAAEETGETGGEGGSGRNETPNPSGGNSNPPPGGGGGRGQT
jgi:general secretion pathway protein J